MPTDAGLVAEAGGEACELDADCSDDNVCTGERCEGGRCSHPPVDEGVVCGDTQNGECTTADTCDGAGVCQPNHLPAGSACGDALETECTSPDTCDGSGACQPRHAAAGSACGSSAEAECTSPDVCDADGLCSPNHAPNGSLCSDGSCTLGECIEGQPEGCPAEVVTDVPFEATWRTVGGVDLFGGGCDVDNTPDHAVVFTAPVAGVFRFEAAGSVGDDDPESGNSGSEELADSVLTIAAGSCLGPGAMSRGCNDDIEDGDLDSRLDLELSLGEVVTVYVGELREPGGGSGSLSITLR